MNKSESISKLAPALVKAQSVMAGAVKSQSNSFFKSKYANLEEVIRVVKDSFAEQGLSFVQFPISSEGMAGVETIILHESGEFIGNEFLLKCSKSDPQGMGSAITYARRYGLQSACGIPSEDDDGNAASAPKEKWQVIAELKAATTIDDLLKAWESLDAATKTLKDVIAAKDAMKKKLSA